MRLHVSENLRTQVQQRFLLILVACLMIAGGIAIAVMTGKLGIAGAVFVIAPIFACLLVYFLFAQPKFGLMTLFVFVWFIMFIIRLGIINFPLGTLVDGLEFLLILGLLVSLKKTGKWHLFKNPISVMIMIWIGYNLIQFANPGAESRLAWLYTIRSVAGVMLTFFLFVYYVDNLKFIRLIFKIWIGLGIIAALYALKQEYIGFSGFEQAELDNNPKLQSLLFINGHWRKFSIFSDPVAFSYNMVACAILCLTLITGQTTIRQKVLLALCSGLFVMAMLTSGTRGAFVLIPAAVVYWGILHFNKKVFIALAVGGILFMGLVNVPTGNPSLQRFQSSFKPSDDASYNVRKQNQKMIQPYIQTHPLGGGLGATGVWGVRFAPYSFLASFPPDSGYIRVAVEMGTVGLGLFCSLMFICIAVGTRNYFLIKDKELRNYCLAMLLIIFALNLGNFPQEALVQFPSSVYFYFYIAMLLITRRLDKEKQASDMQKLTQTGS